MDQSQNYLSEFEEKEKLGTLKTLTILTFIGCGIAFLFSIWGFATADSSYEKMQEAINNGSVDKLPGFVKNMYSPERMEMMRKMGEYKVPILIINLVCTGLCLFGAIQMRKLKADGYWMWLIGEILPFIATAFFVGTAAVTGGFMYISYAIVLVFIILYSMQRKHLRK